MAHDLAKQIFISLILPIMRYCDFVYDGCSKTLSRQLEVVQNSALKAVKGINGHYSATELHSELNIDWLDVACKKSSCIELYKLLQGIGPSCLVSEFELRNNPRHLRSNNALMLKTKVNRTKLADMDFVKCAVNYWETLPIHVKQSDPVDSFKTKVKKRNYLEHVP